MIVIDSIQIHEFSELKELLSVEPEFRKPEEITKIQEHLINFPFFRRIYEEYHINNLVDCAIYFKYANFKAGQSIFSVSQPAENFYILIKGEVQIHKNNQQIRKFNEGVIEECCLVERRKYDSSAVCSAESYVLYTDYQIYSGLFASIREERRIAIVSFLNIQKSFKDWNKAKLMSLSYCINDAEYNEGEVVFSKGDLIEKIFIVRDGVLSIKNHGKMRVVSPGSVIGLDEIESKDIWNYSTVCQSKCTVLYIFKYDFSEKSDQIKKEKKLRVNMISMNKTVKCDFGLSIISFSPERTGPVKGIKNQQILNLTTLSRNGLLRPMSGITTAQRPRTSSTVRPASHLRRRYYGNNNSSRFGQFYSSTLSNFKHREKNI